MFLPEFWLLVPGAMEVLPAHLRDARTHD
jgi:hypothetical protein